MPRVPERGDEIDGRIIDDVGEPRMIDDRHSVVAVRMRDGKYELIFIAEFHAGRSKMRLWETNNALVQHALNHTIEFPVVVPGKPGDVRIWGRETFGNFSAVHYYGEKRTAGLIDTLTYA